LTFRRAG